MIDDRDVIPDGHDINKITSIPSPGCTILSVNLLYIRNHAVRL